MITALIKMHRWYHKSEKLILTKEVNSLLYYLLTHIFMIFNLIDFPENGQCVIHLNTIFYSIKVKNQEQGIYLCNHIVQKLFQVF